MTTALLLVLAVLLSVAAWAAARVVYRRWIKGRIVGGDPGHDGYPDQAAIDRFRHYLNAFEGTDFGVDDETLRAFLRAGDAAKRNGGARDGLMAWAARQLRSAFTGPMPDAHRRVDDMAGPRETSEQYWARIGKSMGGHRG